MSNYRIIESNPIKVEINQENYEIIFSIKSEELILSIKLLNSQSSKKYLKKYLKKQLLFLDVENPFSRLYTLIKEKKMNLSKEENFIELKYCDDQTLINHTFMIPLEEKRRILINQRIENQNELNKTVQKLEKDVTELKEEMKRIKLQNTIMEKTIRRTIDNLTRSIKESNIINIDDSKIIEGLINSKKKINFSLLYSTYKEEDSIINFHNKVDKKGATIIIIKANNKIFGGYNPIDWDSSGKYHLTHSAFLFSLDKKERYNIKKEENNYSFVSDKKYFLFGLSDLCIWDKCTSNSCSFSESSSYSIPDNYEITGGNKFFTVTGFEVYSVSYNN